MRELLLPRQHTERKREQKVEKEVCEERQRVCEEKKCEKQDRGERVREGSERE